MEASNTLKLHGCEEMPSSKNTQLPRDLDCLERIQNSFMGGRWIGQGQYGMAIRLLGCRPSNASRAEDLVVKVGFIDEDELRIACELNALHSETPIFPHTYGWLVCNEIPSEWRALMTREDAKHPIATQTGRPLLFTFIQPVSEKWDWPLNTEHKYRICLFVILHGLWVARSRLGFHHGDLHEGNIMLEINMSRRSEPTILRYGHTEVTIMSELMPRLIDYGRSTTKENPNRGPNQKNDIRFLRDEFLARLDGDDEVYANVSGEVQAFYRLIASPEWRKAQDQYMEEGPDVILPILNHAYFKVDEIQHRATKRPVLALEPIQRCFSCCASNPPYQISHLVAENKYFCHAQCYEKIHNICIFIK